MQVQVIGCYATCWYADKIGQTFEVIEESAGSYRVHREEKRSKTWTDQNGEEHYNCNIDWGIDKEHCRIVS